MFVKKINNNIIKPIQLPSDVTQIMKTFPLFGNINYPNVGIVAKKNSGKTTVLFNILKESASKRTTIIIFSTTIHNDPSWKSIIKYFEKKSINIITYTSIVDNGVNQLEELVQHLMKVKEDEDNEGGEEEHSLIDPCIYIPNCQAKEEEKKEKKPRKEKLPAPEYIVCLDDISNELHNKSVEFLMKRNRHMRIMPIISTQHLNDLNKASRINLDIILLFGGLPEEKLRVIHSEGDLACEFSEFKQLYDFATKDKYNFFYVNLRNGTFRKNFNLAISLNNV